MADTAISRAAVAANELVAKRATASCADVSFNSRMIRAAASWRLAKRRGATAGRGAMGGSKPPAATQAKAPAVSRSTISKRARRPANIDKSHSISCAISPLVQSIFLKIRPLPDSTSCTYFFPFGNWPGRLP